MSEIEDLGLCGQINEMRSAGQHHVSKESRFVNLTISGTGDSDADRDIAFDEIGKIIIGTVSRFCPLLAIPFLVCP